MRHLLASGILLMLLGITASGSIIGFNTAGGSPSDVTASPVTVELYYESLCFACENFISGPLMNAWKTLRKSGIMDLKLYPYGNAHEEKLPDGHYKYICQHGDLECQGNFVEACIQYATSFNSNVYFPVLECMESAKNPLMAAKQCLALFVPNSNWSLVENCVNGAAGEKLMHEYAVRTGKLNPPHNYVPWLVINGHHTEAMQDEAWKDLVGIICKLYNGPAKPQECIQ